MDQATVKLERLKLPLQQRDNRADVGVFMLDGPFDVTVDYNVEPGQREIIAADPDNSQPGYPDSCEITKVIAAEEIVLVDGGMLLSIDGGEDITHLISRSDMERLETSVMAQHREAARANQEEFALEY